MATKLIASEKTVGMCDKLLDSIKPLDGELELKYNKFYIGLAKNGQPSNFVVFRPKKNFLRIEPRLAKSDETQDQLETAGLDVMDYDDRWGRYRIRDFHDNGPELSVEDVIVRSSNVGTARIAVDGWTLLTVVSVFDETGLADDERRSNAGAFYLRY